MNLYLLTQSVHTDYDTYDSCVVVAENEDQARQVHPNGGEFGDTFWDDHSWVPKDHTDKIKVTLLGKAEDNLQPNSVVIASFNAG